MKNEILGMVGAVGSLVATALGGWDLSLMVLVGFMAADYVTGLVVAGVFKKSRKTKNGALESLAGWKGICRKGGLLVIVGMAVCLDRLMNTTYLRDMVCIAYISNEALSILENVGLMGAPIPPAVRKAIEVLQNKEGGETNVSDNEIKE